MIKVKELQEILSKCNPESTIIVLSDFGGCFSLASITSTHYGTFGEAVNIDVVCLDQDLEDYEPSEVESVIWSHRQRRI